jgi:hypothetical protein
VRRAIRLALLSLVGVALPLSAGAQTDDPVFGGWRANPLTVGSRAAGMGGAFVAIADEARAAFVNPAGLTQIPVTEVSVSSGLPWVSAATGRQRIRVAAYYTKGEQEPPPAQGTLELPSLQPAVWEVGAALGVQPSSRVRLGAAVAYRKLRIEEEGRPRQGEPLHPLVGQEDGQVRFTLGMMVDLMPATVVGSSPLKLGASIQPGVTWSFPPRPGDTAAVEIRRPTLSSVGLAWRASSAWSFTGQFDVIRYHEVVDALRRNVGEVAGRDFGLSNAFEPRVGAEFATPLRCGCGTVKVRAGLHYQSPGTLHFDGSDPELRTAFPVRSRRTTVTLGASFFAEHFGNALRFDLDSRDVLDGPALSAGVVWRF